MAELPLSCAPQKVPSYTPLCVPHTSTSSIEARHAGSGARLIRPTYPAKGSALEVTEAGQSPPRPPWLSNFLSEKKRRRRRGSTARAHRVVSEWAAPHAATCRRLLRISAARVSARQNVGTMYICIA